jgi:hypothetical protein
MLSLTRIHGLSLWGLIVTILNVRRLTFDALIEPSGERPMNQVNPEQNAGPWLEALGLVQCVESRYVDAKSQQCVALQIAALNQLETDWTKQPNYQWLARNWETLASVRLPRRRILAQLRHHGPTSGYVNDHELKVALRWDMVFRRRRHFRNQEQRQIGRNTHHEDLLTPEVRDLSRTLGPLRRLPEEAELAPESGRLAGQYRPRWPIGRVQ